MDADRNSVHWVKNATNVDRIIGVGLLIVAALAVYMRFHCLGCLGFRWDEDLTALAVKALLEFGIPELPSGMIYTRFLPFQYVIAASVDVFGFSEFSMRLPSVVFGLALIPLAFLVIRQVFDRKTAMLVAVGIALSFTQVEMARTARMYAPFFVVFLIAAYSIYHAYYRDIERVFSPWPILLSLAAISIHQLAYSLALFLLLAIPLRPTFKRGASLFVQAGIIGVAFLAARELQDHFFYRARRLFETEPAADATAGSGGFIESVLAQISLPDLSLLTSFLSTSEVRTWGFIVIGITAALAWWTFRQLKSRPTIEQICGLLTVVLAGLHQFNLVVIVLALQLVSCGGIPGLHNPAWRRSLVACAALFFLWLAVIGVAATSSALPPVIGEEGTRQLIRRLVDYPNYRLFWSFALSYPLLSPALALGTLWGIDRVSGKSIDPAALFTVGGFWAVLFVNGILTTKFEFLRYNLHVEVLFLAICAVGILELPAMYQRFRDSGKTEYGDGAARKLTIAALLVLVVGVNPLAALLDSHRNYREDGAVFRMLKLDYYPDFKSPADYVRQNTASDDQIFVIDPREYWNYIGRVDYWIYSDNYQSQSYVVDGQHYDMYVGVPVLTDQASVIAALRAAGTGDAWLLYSNRRLARTRWLSPDLKQLFRDLQSQTVYEGRDGDTIVIRIGPDHPLRAAANQP